MIYQLAKSEFENVQNLFKELDFNLIIKAVIEKTSPGRIYVDNVINPRTAFLCSAEGYYLTGNWNNRGFNNSLNEMIVEKIFAGDTVRKDESEISLCFHPDIWKEKLYTVFQGRIPIKTIRRHYLCTKLEVADWKDQIPNGFSVHRVDEQILSRSDLEIPNHLTNWLEINWGSTSKYLESGFGFCMLHDKRIVSWSIADCTSGDACEIGIHTSSDYRRRGLATLTAAAAVEYYLSHGFNVVGWHCDETNLGSRGVAEKVGFELERKYTQYYVCFNEIHHIAALALTHFNAKRYNEATKYLEHLFSVRRDDMPSWMLKEMHSYYHLAARVKAAIGDDEKAIKYLEKAIEKGWTNLDSTMSYKEFNRLIKSKAWQKVILKLEKKLSKADGRDEV
jgi:RimJ/RimL family protein N-acetyltransferase